MPGSGASTAVRLLALVLCAGLILPGCGWHLRGRSDQVMLDALTIRATDADLRFALEEAMEADGVLVHEEAPVILSLTGLRWRTRTVAVDLAGRTTEIELSLHLVWRLLDRGDAALSPPEEITAVRRYQVSPANVAGASDENALARQDIVNEVVARLQQAVATLTPAVESRHAPQAGTAAQGS